MRRHAISLTIYLSLFASGAAGLIYQVAWQRYLSRITGGDHLATAVTLAVFLSGLSVGYAACGRWSVRVRRPVRVYALLEVVIALWGLVFPVLFRLVDRLSAGWRMEAPWGLLAGALVAGGLLLYPPTLLMGATVPFLTQAAASTSGRAASSHALVYGANTAGAFAGALLGGYALLPTLGLPGSVAAAALLNLFAALLLLFAAAGTGADALALDGSGEVVVERERPLALRRLLLLSAASGAATMILENAAARLLSITLGGTAYVFALTVAVFVAAIATGSFLVGRLRRVPGTLLSTLLLASSAGLLALYAGIDDAPYAMHVVRTAFSAGGAGFWGYHAAVLVLLLSLLGPVAAMMGALLPLLYHEMRARPEDAGASSGRLLAWNAVGCLAGSLLGGVFAYPLLDSPRVFALVPGLCALMALAAGAVARRRLAAGFLAASAAFLAVTGAGIHRKRLAINLLRFREENPRTFSGPSGMHDAINAGKRLAFYREGPMGLTAVSEPVTATGDQPEWRSILNNGRSDSSTKGDEETLKLGAHLPALLAGRRERVLVIGLGTGVTAGEFSLHPEVRELRVVEIARPVVEALPLFSRWTHAVERDPRLRIERADALLALRRGPERWDIISSEPSHPWLTGVDQLFSRDFYLRVDARLADGGLFVQWFHRYESSPEELRLISGTLRGVFPCLRAFRGTLGDVLVVAGRRPLEEAEWVEAARRLIANGGVRDSLAAIGVTRIEALRAREIVGFQAFADRAAEGPIHTLDFPILQYEAIRALYSGRPVDESIFARAEAPARPGDASGASSRR